jgi:hypothetical protein
MVVGFEVLGDVSRIYNLETEIKGPFTDKCATVLQNWHFFNSFCQRHRCFSRFTPLRVRKHRVEYCNLKTAVTAFPWEWLLFYYTLQILIETTMEIWQHINCPPVPTKYAIFFSKKLVFLKNWLCTASKSDDTNDNPACKRMYLDQSITLIFKRKLCTLQL